ncbi:gpp [Symbiodinium sp. CCMP2592]|nr:gpp [Symbiodinium sp. CCMP2592]
MEPSSWEYREVKVRRLERGKHQITFFSECPEAGARRFVCCSKGSDFATPAGQDFHWIVAVEPGQAGVIVASIQTQFWVFESDSAFLTHGWLEASDPTPLCLPADAAEFLAVGFSVSGGFCLEDSASDDAYHKFYEAYSFVDGYQLSYEAQGGCTTSALTYGESHFVPIYHLLSMLQVEATAGDLLVDLGSGTGRLVAAAALAFPLLRCRGIELLPALHTAALQTKARLPEASLELVLGDILQEDWSDASIVVAMSLCFPAEMMKALEAKFALLRPGSRVVLMNCFLESDLSGLAPLCLDNSRETAHAVRLEMSFGETPLYVFERVDQKRELVDLTAMD